VAKELRPILTINSHEAWVHQLGYLGRPLQIIDGMPGRYCKTWDVRMRPVPASATLIARDQVVLGRRAYECIIAHSVADLMALKECVGPRILVLHTTLEGRAGTEGTEVPSGFVESVQAYLKLVKGIAVAVGDLKARSWRGTATDVVPFGIDVDCYLPHLGNIAAGIRVSNQIEARRDVLAWDFHERAFADIPVRLVGHNPDRPGVEAAQNWDDLKRLLSEHRLYIHTAHPELEEGYNMAMLEAMAAGLPVLGNRLPGSPIEHGINGFVSDDPVELAGHARSLLADPELAARMGQAARRTVRERFPIASFTARFTRVIQRAAQRWTQRRPRARKHEMYG
jgi:hypothetical protein